MGASSFSPGAQFELNGRTYRLQRLLPDQTWQAEDIRTSRVAEFTIAELQEHYTNRRLVFDNRVSNGNCTPAPILPSDAAFDLAKVRRVYALAAMDIPNTQSAIEAVIQEVWARLQQPAQPPHWTSVYRWKTKLQKSGKDIRALLADEHKKGNRSDRYPQEVIEMAKAAIEARYLTEERRTLQDTLDNCRAAIIRENRLRPDAMQLPLPSRRLLSGLIADIPAFDRYAARHGRIAATKRFRSVQAHRTTQAPLERAEIDHTPLDLMVIDDDTGLPLGRPYLTCCVDDNTRCMLGINIGFEPPSYLTVARCLKHAFLPKSNLRAMYPSIKNDWAAHGVMRELVVDNGAEFHSQSLENACFTLGIEIHYSARKTPWFKGKVERLQGTLNRAIAHGNPGTTFSNIFDKEDYDPSKNAVIRYSVLKEIVHMWVVDVYHQQPHRTLGVPPAVAWQSGISNEDILLPDNPAELDAIMGRSETRRLTHKGIELGGLTYNSPALTSLRRRHGDKLDVELRIDDGDLGQIVVLSPGGRQMFTVPSLSPQYAKGLSSWQHRVCKKFAAKQLKKYDPEGWLEAKAAISRLIDEEFMHKKQRSRTKIARHKDNALPPPSQPNVALPAPKPEQKPRTEFPQQDAPQALTTPEPLTLADISGSKSVRTAKRFQPQQRQRSAQVLEVENAELLGGRT
ncbi:Mu transposase C-terminal domain-containing protein [Dechloromonas sp.]|uniref:Mu transposase C-terminal domain-containing protein n=1 Tax=Dechloromonas sp. TaxID=1917218 RepID=UPI0011FD114C|nr:Mu transposase C-terminal domain-containing protein [Dechloromonas sp.]MBU3695430.1 DDE-type integrase/transposase/recombinase [Dechloromonas sp.]TEX48720.1 MAG: integrase [Rhodocyclaceae bacterium]